jgi:protein-disulfide isomerase
VALESPRPASRRHRTTSTPLPEAPTGDLRVPVAAEDHVQGLDTAAVTMVEYADYECPYSRRAYSVIKQWQREVGVQLRFVYRNFPLRDVHPHAQHAAEAAEVAANQGKFWEMHDYLFEHQRALDDEHLRQGAEQLGLDTVSYEQDMARHRYAGKIEDDLQGGIQSGVRGTPTLFIHGARYEGNHDRESLLRAIREVAAVSFPPEDVPQRRVGRS